MNCPSCGAKDLQLGGECLRCGAPAIGTPDGTMTVSPEHQHLTRRYYSAPQQATNTSEFTESMKVANRYVIQKLVGFGGMGAVYRAHDMELDRVVALKTIRSQMAFDEASIARFKKEIILSSQVTHRNVCRVFDLGQHEEIKFLTMEFIEGQTLGDLMRDNRQFSFQEIGHMMAQTVDALEAAHEAGVVHRDLKPDNIMVDDSLKVTVMDFGIARTVGEVAMHGFSGTPRYSAPEQIRGEAQDRRSDLYSFGMIFYELVTGAHPFPDASSMNALRRRADTPVPPLSLNRPDVPDALGRIILRCLAANTSERYSSAAELATAVRKFIHPEQDNPFSHRRGLAAALAATILIVAGAAVWWNRPAPPAPRPVTLLIADIDNHTGEAVFTGAIEPALQVALEGAPFITTYDRVAARRLVARLRPASVTLDTEGAVLVAVREGIGAVVKGSIRSQAGRYTLSLRAIDPSSGKDLLRQQQTTTGRDQILTAVGKLSVPMRRAFGDTTPEGAQLKAAETFTAASIEAAKAYAKAQELQLGGQYDDALNAYEEAIRLDPGMGRAYAGRAVLNRNFNRPQEALQDYELALSHLDRMSERERLRTRGGYYVTANNNEKAVEEFTKLVRGFPADTAGHANLALALLFLRKTAPALEEGRKAIEIYPKNLVHRSNVALYAMYGGDYATALKEADVVAKQNPEYEKPHVAIALASIARNQPLDALRAYEKLSRLGVRGQSVSSVGLADLAVYQGRLQDALDELERGIAADESQNRTEDAARKRSMAAQVLALAKRPTDARWSAERAAQASSAGTLIDAALTLVDVGAAVKAEEIAQRFRTRVGAENQAAARMIDGYRRMPSAPVDATGVLRSAQQQLDTWLGRFLLGRAYLAAGAYAEAHSEFETCLKRSGEALAVHLDDIPTARLIPMAMYYFAVAEDRLHVETAAQAYETFLSTQTASPDQNPIAIQARLRLAEIQKH